MVQFIPAKDDWANAARGFGSGLAQGYMNRADENALRKAIGDLVENPSARQILDAVTGTKTYSPAAKQQMLRNYLDVAKFEQLEKKAKEQSELEYAKLNQENEKKQQERQNVQNIVNQLDLPEEQKESLGASLSQASAENLLKDQLKGKGNEKLTPFEKKVQEKNAEEYINLTKEIPKIETVLGDIEYARKLSNELGTLGVVTGALGLSEKAKELEGVSFTLMEPIVKIFNPSGPIAQQKLRMIQDKYVIKPSDAPWTKTAKLNALERFAKQAKDRAIKKKALIEKYNGNPPKEEIEGFDRESDTISDAMIDYDFVAEEVKQEGMPDATKFKGKTITSPEGKKFYSDGTRWVKK